jgi:ElaB/YqjD/DUF883 family membrane-anchored ribosome-binding protein
MRTNGQRKPQEILAEIDRTRSDMDSTLTAIEQRLTPGQLVDQGLDYLRHSGASDFAANLGNSVRDNPLPVSLVGIGLAWLMAAGKSGSGRAATGPSTGQLGERGRNAAQGAKEAIGSVKDQVSGTLDSARAGLQSARQRAGDLTQGARDAAAQIGDTARQQAQRAKNGIDYLVREQPLALGAIGLAIGALVAASAPRTQKEDELLGEASDRLADRAKDMGKEQLQKVQDAASEAAGSTPRESSSSGAGGGEQPSGPYVDSQTIGRSETAPVPAGPVTRLG